METPAEWLYAVVDATDNSTTVYNGPCLLRSAHIAVALSAHITLIKDSTTTIGAFPASAPAGQWVSFGDVRCETSLVVDPDDSTSVGTIVVVYKPFHDGKAG